MNEKDLNIEYICEKTLLNKDDELVPIILDLIQDSYKAGLCQAEFDNTMNLIEENQELKLELSGYRQAILNNKEMLGLKEKNQELKKQNQELELQNFNLREDVMIKKMSLPNKKIKDKTFFDLYDMPTYENLLTQQKRFIKYLEDEKDRLIKETSHYYIDSFDRQYAVNETIYDEVDIILQKYKEIIGDDK